MDSLLFKTFRLKYGLVYSIRSNVTNYKNCSIFEINSQIDPSNSQKFFEIFDAEFEQMINNVTKEMFDKTIKYTDYQSLMTYDSVREISGMIINESLKNRTVYLPEDYIKLSKKISFDKMQAFFKEKLTKENRYTFCMTPTKPEN
jgi:predicted Zn-dependent peptidase